MALTHPARESVLRETLRLGVPAMLGLLSNWGLGLADVYMVGRLATDGIPTRGVSAIANVHIGSTYILAMVITFAALSVGTQAVAARRWGERDRPSAARALTAGLMLALVVSALLLPLYQVSVGWIVDFFTSTNTSVNTAVVTDYLQIRLWAIPALLMLFAMRGWFNGVGNTAVVMALVLVENALNIALNWGLIEGHWGFPRLEESGAALASALASWFGLALLALYTLMARRYADLHLLRRWKTDRVMRRRIARLSLPSFIHLAAAHTGFLIFLGVIVPRTHEGLAAVAASGIVWTTASLSFFVALGFGVAAATMMGQGLGSGDHRFAVRGVWTAVTVAWIINVTIAAGYVIFGRWLTGIFTDDPEVIRLGGWLFVIVASFQFIDNFGIILSEAFKGAGMTLFVMLVETPLNLGLFLGLAWWWGVRLGWGVVGAWAAMIVYAVVFAVIMIVCFRRGLWRRGQA